MGYRDGIPCFSIDRGPLVCDTMAVFIGSIPMGGEGPVIKRRLGRFLNLPEGDRGLLVRAAVMLGVTRIGLQVLPFRSLLRLLLYPGSFSTRPRPSSAAASVGGASLTDRVVWAVSVASAYVPGARSCLPRALAAQSLLEQRGVPARLRLGLARSESGTIEGHAWVESDGRVIIGGTDVDRYTAIESFGKC